MTKNESLLFLNMTDDYSEAKNAIESLCKFQQIDFAEHKFKTLDELEKFLGTQNQLEFDYIYVGSHGNEEGIASCSSGTDFIRWADFGVVLCNSSGLKNSTVLMLGCCKGGIKRGALTLFSRCQRFNRICGMQCNLNGPDAALAFQTFVHASRQHLDDNTIAARVSAGLGKQFSVLSRYEMDVEIMTLNKLLFQHPNAPQTFYTSQELENQTQSLEAQGLVELEAA
jgi:hypothetical protein